MVDRIFYDGGCALCHGAVRFVIKRLPSECTFRFAPLAGPTFTATVSEAARRGLPDSIVVQTSTGELLSRSAAAIYVLSRLGPAWRLAGRVARLVPRAIADTVYDLIARNRFRIFGRTETSCPILPDELAKCFDP